MIRKCEYTENDSFVSIGHTFVVEGDEPSTPYTGRFLRILFDDVLFDIGHAIAITHEDAREILKFIDAHDTGSVHIHCQAGQSRSTAVAESIAAYFRKQGKFVEVQHRNPDFSPNKRVLHVFNEILA